MAGGKPSLAKEDQAVLHTLKSNMADPQVRAIVDSEDSRRAMKIFEEELGDVQQTGMSWEDSPEDELGSDFITPDMIHFDPSSPSHTQEIESEVSDDSGEAESEPIPVFETETEEEFHPENITAHPEPARPSPRRQESHDIIEVSADDIRKEGMSLEGVSHSIDMPEPEPEEPEYIKPPIDILNEVDKPSEDNLQEELRANAEKLVSTLQSFGVQTRIIDIARGPAVTRYELQPSAGVKISKITNLADDIALNLAASGVRIEAPIPNKPAVGIEVPNKVVSTVSIREIIDSPEFQSAKSPLSVAMGRDIAGKITVADLAKMPHTLIAGSTGSGKSVCINSLIVSMLYHSTRRR